MQAGYSVMSEKGIDAATMQEIAERADVGAGTVYSYFKSKDELAVAVIERVMHNLALRIEQVTNTVRRSGAGLRLRRAHGHRGGDRRSALAAIAQPAGSHRRGDVPLPRPVRDPRSGKRRAGRALHADRRAADLQARLLRHRRGQLRHRAGRDADCLHRGGGGAAPMHGGPVGERCRGAGAAAAPAARPHRIPRASPADAESR